MTFVQKSWRLAPMYFFYFALFGIFMPYVARFLIDKGLNGQEISIIVAIINGVNMFAPFLFSFLADKTGRRVIFIRIGSVSMALFFLATLAGHGFWFYLTVLGFFGVFLSATLPQMESITLSILGSEKRRYGQIRLWGSIGFVSIVWLQGILLDQFSVNIIIYFGFVAILLMTGATFFIPERPLKAHSTADVLTQSVITIAWRQVFILLLVIIFWQFGLAPYNTFFDLYLQGNGHSAATNGFLISFGSFSEIVIFLYVSRLFLRFSERFLIGFALIMTILRWLLVYCFAECFWIVFASQGIHAVTFGVVHSVAIHRIGHLFPENRASFGQGLYVAIGNGFGLLVGNLLAGWLWDGSGVIYLQGAFWTVLALIVAWFGFSDGGVDKSSQPT